MAQNINIKVHRNDQEAETYWFDTQNKETLANFINRLGLKPCEFADIEFNYNSCLPSLLPSPLAWLSDKLYKKVTIKCSEEVLVIRIIRRCSQ